MQEPEIQELEQIINDIMIHIFIVFFSGCFNVLSSTTTSHNESDHLENLIISDKMKQTHAFWKSLNKNIW